MLLRLCQWLIFTVIVALSPFLIAALNVVSEQQTLSWFPREQLWPHGELMLVTTALAADAIGDLFVHPSPRDAITVLSAGAFLILVIVTVAWYTMVQSHANYVANTVSRASLILFGFVVIGGAFVKVWLNRPVHV